MADPGMQALAMLRRSTARRAQRGTHDHWHFELATRHVMHLRRLVKDLVHRQTDEVTKHNIYDWTHARHGCTDAHTSNTLLRNRRVNHTLGAKLFDQPGKHFERGTSLRDI